MKKKDRLKIPRQDMPQRDELERRRSFDEVNLGMGLELARTEAERCVSCANPECIRGCPVGVNVREFVELVRSGDYLAAARKIREDNVLPAITGRVCPQENQCEGACVLGKRFEPLGIGYLERFVADYEAAHGKVQLPDRAPATGRRVAIVGSGPAGLACAGDLVRAGHDATVFEALHDIGGVLLYGIPEFRLPEDIVHREVENLRLAGVRFETDVVIGRTLTIDELLDEEGHDAVFIATGAGLPRFMGIPGEDLNGVYSANEFLTRVNLMKAYLFPDHDEPIHDCRSKHVAVVGGGNTALDAARSAVRLGAAKTSILYRRSDEEMPGRAEEIRHAREEGIDVRTLVLPYELRGDDDGWLVSAACRRMELGEPDDSGRRRPVPVEGSEFEIPVDVLVVAIGTSANPIVQSTTPDLTVDARGYIAVDEHMATSKRGVFAGGDIVTGTATVIEAMGAGRRAARGLDAYLASL